MIAEQLKSYRQEIEHHLTQELLPFWEKRIVDKENGGYITHFDKDGNDSGEDEKSLIAQTRSIYTFSSAHRAGYGDGRYAEIARHGVDFLIRKMWDTEHGGFYWLMDRKGNVKIDEKIIYGHSFAIYCLSEYTLATGDPIGLEYAEKVFDLLQQYGADTYYGGYFEMFHRNWELKGPGSAGGDRKTLDAHMHLMEAFTTLYEASHKQVHRRKLVEVIQLLVNRVMHPEFKTGIPQFWADWSVAPQIKFDIIWGWDRFTEDGMKSAAEDNTSYGHNVEFAWLLMHALDVAGIPYSEYQEQLYRLGIWGRICGRIARRPGLRSGKGILAASRSTHRVAGCIPGLYRRQVYQGIRRHAQVRFRSCNPLRGGRMVPTPDPSGRTDMDPHEPLLEDQLPHGAFDDPGNCETGQTAHELIFVSKILDSAGNFLHSPFSKNT
jgi:mannose/cellobiose epimerase-like protein (N-acyl-D-glucosamine 2-epimerase family)